MEIQETPQKIGGTQMERIKEEWAAFQALPFGKKLEHIWIYYKWYILVAAAVICVLVSILGTVASNRKETLISGIFINNAAEPEGYTCLTEGFWEYCGADPDQKVELVTGRSIDFESETPSQQEAAAFMTVTCMIAAKTLDYIITDEASAAHFMEQEVVMDLRQLLPEEVLAQWDTIEQDGAVIALGLEGTAFARKYPLAAENSCILVIANAPNPENMVRFLEYLMALA